MDLQGEISVKHESLHNINSKQFYYHIWPFVVDAGAWTLRGLTRHFRLCFRNTTMNSRFSGKEASEPGNNVDIRHTKLGIWDLYEQLDPNFSSPRWFTAIPELYDELVRSWPYLLRMVKDIFGVRSCRASLFSFIAIRLLLSLLPAVELW